MIKNIILIGVGGQGTILTSKILSAGLMKLGYDVKMSEIHGMSQRGGSVTTQIRYGEKVYSPVIGEGEADIMVAFEKSEAIRGLSFLKKDGTIVVDDFEIYSLPVMIGNVEYPDSILEAIQSAVKNVQVMNAAKIAEALGNSRAQNIVLLGSLVAFLELDGVDWVELVGNMVPPKAKAINQKAFKTGFDLFKNKAVKA